MHAAIKIISFLVFGAAVSTGNDQVLLAGMLMVVPLYFFVENTHLRGAVLMLRRLKWLFISIFAVYLFFTPGQLLLPGVLWGPTAEGLLQGVLRIAALVLLVAAVNLLITSTEQEEFLSAVLWCLHPVSLLGFSHERMAVRITLTLDAVSQARSNFEKKSSPVKVERGGPRFSAISATACRLFETTITTAESATLRKIPLPEETRPPMVQWFIPIILFVVFVLIQNINIGEFV